LVEVKAEPRLDHGVDIERADLPAQRHDIDRGGVYRQVDAKTLAAAGRQERHQELAVIVAGHALLDETHAVLSGDLAVLVRVNDDEARFVVSKMPLDQRQGAFADRAKADHDNGAGNFRVDWRGGAHKWVSGKTGIGRVRPKGAGRISGMRGRRASRSPRSSPDSRACSGQLPRRASLAG